MSDAPIKTMGFKVRPLSTARIRTLANKVRVFLGIGHGRFDPIRLIDILSLHGVVVDIVEANQLPAGAEGCCDTNSPTIYLSSDTYTLIEQGKPRGWFTLLHELGHLLLAHRRVPLRDTRFQHETYEDSEWQANTFAAEFLMPLDVIKSQNLLDAESVAEFFYVSKEAAEYRLTKLRNKGELQ